MFSAYLHRISWACRSTWSWRIWKTPRGFKNERKFSEINIFQGSSSEHPVQRIHFADLRINRPDCLSILCELSSTARVDKWGNPIERWTEKEDISASAKIRARCAFSHAWNHRSFRGSHLQRWNQAKNLQNFNQNENFQHPFIVVRCTISPPDQWCNHLLQQGENYAIRWETSCYSC